MQHRGEIGLFMSSVMCAVPVVGKRKHELQANPHARNGIQVRMRDLETSTVLVMCSHLVRISNTN